MGRFEARPPRMRNYKLEQDIELSTVRNADGSELVWKFNDRVDICEPFIKQYVDFAKDLRQIAETPSLFDEGEVVSQCLNHKCKLETVKSWVFLHLFDHAVQQANAIFFLLEASFIQPGLQLWRSLLEASVICDFIAKNQAQNPKMCQDYLVHTLLRMWIRHKKDYNRHWQRKRKEPYYNPAEISMMESDFERTFGRSYNDDYSWTRPSIGKSLKFSDMLEGIEGHERLMLYYRLSSKEIHPTIGSKYVILGLSSLPLPIVPMLPRGDGHVFSSFDEMYLDRLTVEVLLLITNRVGSFLTLDSELKQSLSAILADGRSVLRKLGTQFKNDRGK